MSAIEPLGYPDWQRLTNWDGPVLWQPATGLHNATLVGPVMRVDRYHSLSCLMTITAGKANFTIIWYADQGLTSLLAARQVYLDGAGGNTAITRLVNLGAWCQVSIFPIAGGSFTLNPTYFCVSNRSFPSEFTANDSLLANVQNRGIIAGGTITQQVIQVVAGRAHLWSGSASGKGTTQLFAMDAAGTYDQIFEARSDAAGEVNADVELPQASVQLRLVNTSGVADTFWAALVSNGR